MNAAWWVNEDDLDEDQRSVIDIPLDKKQLIVGAAGSGKTNLLLMKGSQFVLVDRPNVLFLVFTNGLKEWIRLGADHYDFKSENVKTFQGFMMHLLKEGNVPFSNQLQDDFPKDRQTLLRLSHQYLNQKNYSAMYDAIIVDEGQDCLPDEVALFNRLGKVVIAAMDERQQIYDRNDAGIEAWRDAISPTNTVKLRYHYRTGKKICKVADAVVANDPATGMEATSRYDEKTYPSVVRRFKCNNLQEEVALAIASLETELKAYPGEMLGILCTNRATLNSAVTELQSSSINDLCIFHINDGEGCKAFGTGKKIFVGTIYGGKGLEFRTVHLLGAEQMRTSNRRNLAYTAVTRAKTSLNVYHSGELPTFLTSALSLAENTKAQPKLSELFGRKRENVD